jgi:CO/xanthine dehydrogenase Mo-binding subunit
MLDTSPRFSPDHAPRNSAVSHHHGVHAIGFRVEVDEEFHGELGVQRLRMPRADDLCPVTVEDICVPTARNLLGVKGVGEAGTVGALARTMSAIKDALQGLGVESVDMPATPDAGWRLISRAA